VVHRQCGQHHNLRLPSPTDEVVLRWDEATLAAIRATKPGPTVVAARALAVVHTAMYEAWAQYDAAAVGAGLGGTLRRPATERLPEFKSKAISFADGFGLEPDVCDRMTSALGDQQDASGQDTDVESGTAMAGLTRLRCGQSLDESRSQTVACLPHSSHCHPRAAGAL